LRRCGRAKGRSRSKGATARRPTRSGAAAGSELKIPGLARPLRIGIESGRRWRGPTAKRGAGRRRESAARRSLENPNVPLNIADPDDLTFTALGGTRSAAGVRVGMSRALGYPAVWRAVNLISGRRGEAAAPDLPARRATTGPLTGGTIRTGCCGTRRIPDLLATT
jgi:hypothetical protein